MSAQRFAAVCAYCLGTFQLNPSKASADRPIRHGFNVVGGVGQGCAGGWHTGPCFGVCYPHFGISTAGTVAALEVIQFQIKNVESTIRFLDTHPELHWKYQPTIYKAATWQVRKSTRVPDGESILRVLTPGTEAEKILFRTSKTSYDQTVNCPSYKQEWGRRTSEAKASLDSLQRTEQVYQDAIKKWKPADAKPVTTVKIVHKAVIKYSGVKLPKCSRMRGARGAPMTDNDAEVTCKRCLAR